MSTKRISRKDAETTPLIQLMRLHSDAEITEALKRYRRPPSKKRRTKLNEGHWLAVWVAVEWKRDQAKIGRHSVKRASVLLAEELESSEPVAVKKPVATVTPSPAWSRISGIHRAAEVKAKSDASFRKRLDADLSRLKNTLWPDDEVLPAIFVGGEELAMWVVYSDKPDGRK